MRTHGDKTKSQIAKYALEQLETARRKDVEAHEKNRPAMEINKVIRLRIESLMAEVGMPAKWSERDTKSRARYPRSITMEAGYLNDLRKHVPTDDGFDYATSTYERLKRDYDAYAEAGKLEDQQAQSARQQAEERRKAERRANLELAAIILRYDLDPDSDWQDILDALRTKDQRLDLAVAMRRVRGDWSDGPGPVSVALDRFKIVTDQDKEIANDIVGCLNSWDGDGRTFRDTSWNYDRLFASVEDTQLSADIQLAYERSDRE
ncbi:MAG: hypothetical protein E6Q98_15735 [Rhodospirillaceae bacterium]|nr:MAG: hypothetical protein E6Q98_15735 [Rhodospirillaceae bacterium]